MMVLRLALRNVLRHRRRSLLTALAVVSSFALLLVATGLADGAHEAMADTGVRMGLGHTVVQARGYQDDPSLDHVLHAWAPLAASMRDASGGAAIVAPRLRAEGLLQAGSEAVGVIVSGVDPDVEPRVSKIEAKAAIVAGEALPKARAPRAEGELPPVVIGRRLADQLHVSVGDRATITLRPAGNGAARTGAFRVEGVFETGVRDVDGGWVEIPIDAAQRLAAAGDGVTMLAALLPNVADTARYTDAVARDLAARDVEVLPWPKVAPELYATILLDEGSMYLMMVIVFLVVAAGILNTVLMGVLERTREFGVLLAIGTTPRRIVAIVLCEAAILGAISIAAGLAVGLLGNHHFATAGLDVREVLGGGVETSGILLPDKFYAHLAATKVAWSTAAVLALVVLGAVYPALRASRLEPVEAIRHV
jgi:ABC-type lipoprotein release transport system permease subunit